MLLESIVPGAHQPANVDVPLAEGAKQVIFAALQHAETANLQLLHILWALTIDGESAVGKLLKAHDITVEQVDAAIQKAGA